MINFIKMNMMRFVKMKSIYIMLIVTTFIGAFFIIDNLDTTALEQEQARVEQQQEAEEGVHITTNEQGNEKSAEIEIVKGPVEINTLSDYIEQFNSSGIMPLEMAIFIIIFALGERNSGFLKNLNVCTKKKEKIIVSKLVPATAFFMMQNIMVTITLVIGNIIGGCGLAFGNIASLAVQLSVQLLLELAFTASMLAIAELIRNNTACICIGIFASLGVGSLILSVLCGMISKVVQIPNLGQYTLVQRMAMTVTPFDMSLLPVTLVIGVVALIGYTVLTIYMAKKRDIY